VIHIPDADALWVESQATGREEGSAMIKRNVFSAVVAIAFISCLGYAQDQPPVPGTQAASKLTAAHGTMGANAVTAPSAAPVAATAAGGNNQTPAPLLERRNQRYRIELGDVISLDFPFTPEYDENVTVQPDGYITLITVGEMHVVGMTIAECKTALEQAYASILHKPIIAVGLSTFENPYFIVGGEVGKPGKYDLHGDTTLTQAVEIAGGFTYTSKHSHVLLFRRVSDDWVSARVVNVKKMLTAGDLAEDLHIEPGDMVFVPKNRLSKVQPYLPYLLPYQLFRINFNANTTSTYIP
jgi:polysaccharide export outer membrane protein